MPQIFRNALLALFVSVFSALSVCAQSPAQASTASLLDEILSGKQNAVSVRQLAISPDGKRLAFQLRGDILVAPIDNLDKRQQITAATTSSQACQESNFAWSPDSAALAFFSDCARPGEQSDLYIARFNGSRPQRLTALHGEANSPAFSPDARSIAFLYVENATRHAGALAAMRAPSGVIGEDHIEIQRVAIVAADLSQPAAPQSVTPANLHVYEFDWAPDSHSLAYVAANPPGENNWWVAKLYTQPLQGEAHPILAPAEISGPLHGLQIAVPRWSPDGKSIAFIGGLMSDQGSTGGDLWVVSSAGGQPRNLTPNRPSSPTWISWNGSNAIDVSELAGGEARLVRLYLNGNGSTSIGVPVFSFAGTVRSGGLDQSLSFTADHALVVFEASSYERAPEIYAVKTPVAAPASGATNSADLAPSVTPNHSAELTSLTRLNGSLHPLWGRSVSLDWTSDGFKVQGWLLLPKDYDPAKKYPLVVEVHGGPGAASLSRWGTGGGLSATAFSALGYFVFLPNFRGSFGQGEAFTLANRKDFGYGDLRDILAGVDTVLARYPVDPNRVGITGWSYGGFMSMFAVTQTYRFRAGVAGAGISNWQSYYGENSIGEWMIPFFGASVYDDPQVYAKSSAINFIKNAATPTLVLVGDRDGECPAPQSFEFWHALRAVNVPAKLVVYPDEGHSFASPAHRQDVLKRSVDWFAHYMPPESQEIKK